NYPNPFNPSTTISFSFTTEITENTEIAIYNLKGQKVKTFSNLQIANSPNSPTVIWDGTDLTGKPVSSGIYFCKLQAGKLVKTQKMLLMK
ncbi:MAG TPA: T9SS type A sorting domain-containing protein, partial [Candidatus Cloacimonadota bacterium]|nr:T9SS type A sorting domain-containing protein [Candidatus Cloacimonadota bacterium]